jgi:hypothetical protein
MVGDLSIADEWSGMKLSMSSPAMTPSFSKPRETPSPPSAIILLPETWLTRIRIPPRISRPLVSVKKQTRQLFNLPDSASSCNASTTFVNSLQFEDSSDSSIFQTPIRHATPLGTANVDPNPSPDASPSPHLITCTKRDLTSALGGNSDSKNWDKNFKSSVKRWTGTTSPGAPTLRSS